MLMGAGIASVILGGTSVVWACTPQLPFGVTPLSAAPLSAVTVSGSAPSGAVEIRWDGVEGPVIGQADAGSALAVGVRIPDAAPGMHTIVAVTRGTDGTVSSKGVASFEVTAPGAAPGKAAVASNHWSGDKDATQVVGSTSSGFSHRALGLAFLGTGSAALFGAFAVVEARKRRVFAHSVARR